MTYLLMLFPFVIVGISLFFLPAEVVVRYNSESVSYGSKYALFVGPVIGLWMGIVLLLAEKVVSNGQGQDRIVKRISYLSLAIVHLVTLFAIVVAFVK